MKSAFLRSADLSSTDPEVAATAEKSERQAVPVRYEHSINLAALLSQLEISLVITTYQAGRVVSVGSKGEQLQIGFAHLPQAMGLTRTPTGLAIGSRDAIWTFPASREIAPRIKPEGTHDIAFLARSAHYSGLIMGHDLAWCGNQLWGVNTLFNCLCTFEAPWSFVPRWRPGFISALQPGDRCHLNGMAVSGDGSAPAYVTALGGSDSENGWRDTKATGGCLIEVASGDVVLRGLSMPHSPRLHRGNLYLLDSGHGHLLRCDPATAKTEVICELPGFTRGLDCYVDRCSVGPSVHSRNGRVRRAAPSGARRAAALRFRSYGSNQWRHPREPQVQERRGGGDHCVTAAGPLQSDPNGDPTWTTTPPRPWNVPSEDIAAVAAMVNPRDG